MVIMLFRNKYSCSKTPQAHCTNYTIPFNRRRFEPLSIRRSIDTFLVLDSKYLNNLRASLNKDGFTPWFIRVQDAYKRMITAIIYRETSFTTYELNPSAPLPIIGYYYSMFHLAIAMLRLDYATSSFELQDPTHRKIFKLLDAKLLQRNILNQHFMDVFHELKKYREFINYSFVQTIIETDPSGEFTKMGGRFFEFKDILPRIYESVRGPLEIALDFINKVLIEVKIKFGSHLEASRANRELERMRDIVIEKYMSREDKTRILRTLSEYDLLKSIY